MQEGEFKQAFPGVAGYFLPVYGNPFPCVRLIAMRKPTTGGTSKWGRYQFGCEIV